MAPRGAGNWLDRGEFHRASPRACRTLAVVAEVSCDLPQWPRPHGSARHRAMQKRTAHKPAGIAQSRISWPWYGQWSALIIAERPFRSAIGHRFRGDRAEAPAIPSTRGECHLRCTHHLTAGGRAKMDLQGADVNVANSV